MRPVFVRTECGASINTNQIIAAIASVQPQGGTNINVTEAFNARATAMEVSRRQRMKGY